MALQRALLKTERWKGGVDDLGRVQDSREGLIQNGRGNDSERVEDPGENLIQKGYTGSVDRLEDSTAIYYPVIKELSLYDLKGFQIRLDRKILMELLVRWKVYTLLQTVPFACYL